MLTLKAPPQEARQAPKYQRIREVPLETKDDSTLLINCGYAEMRVEIDQRVTGKELREFCHTVKGWELSKLRLSMTDVDGKVAVFEPGAQADAAAIQPTARQVEWVQRVGHAG